MSDLIDRRAAIDCVKSNPFLIKEMKTLVCNGIKALPSAQPDPLTEEEKRLLKKLRSYHSGSYAKILDKLVASAQPEIIRCKDCKHKPYTSDKYDYDNGDCGFEIIFPDYRCPCRCEDEYYNRIPDDDWFCGNAERRTDEDK